MVSAAPGTSPNPQPVLVDPLASATPPAAPGGEQQAFDNLLAHLLDVAKKATQAPTTSPNTPLATFAVTSWIQVPQILAMISAGEGAQVRIDFPKQEKDVKDASAIHGEQKAIHKFLAGLHKKEDIAGALKELQTNILGCLELKGRDQEVVKAAAARFLEGSKIGPKTAVSVSEIVDASRLVTGTDDQKKAASSVLVERIEKGATQVPVLFEVSVGSAAEIAAKIQGIAESLASKPDVIARLAESTVWVGEFRAKAQGESDATFNQACGAVRELKLKEFLEAYLVTPGEEKAKDQDEEDEPPSPEGKEERPDPEPKNAPDSSEPTPEQPEGAKSSGSENTTESDTADSLLVGSQPEPVDTMVDSNANLLGATQPNQLSSSNKVVAQVLTEFNDTLEEHRLVGPSFAAELDAFVTKFPNGEEVEAPALADALEAFNDSLIRRDDVTLVDVKRALATRVPDWARQLRAEEELTEVLEPELEDEAPPSLVLNRG